MKVLDNDTAIEIFRSVDPRRAAAMHLAYQSIVSLPKADPWEDRDGAIDRATAIFTEAGGITNVSTAFALYQKYLATKDRPVFVSEKRYGTEFYRRPTCPDCQRPMQLWEVNTHPKNMVGGDFKTQWVCPEEIRCGYQGEYSTLSWDEWKEAQSMDNLETSQPTKHRS